jgi:hypothetical protein
MIAGRGILRIEHRRDRRHGGQDGGEPGDDNDTTTEQPSTESTPSI